MSKNIVQLERPQTTIKFMRMACSIPKATNTHSEYVILIAFLLQQRTSMLRHTYSACLAKNYKFFIKYHFLLTFHNVLYFLLSIRFIKTAIWKSPHSSAALCTTENDIRLFEQTLKNQILRDKMKCEMHVRTDALERLSNSIFKVRSTTTNMEVASSSTTLYV